MLAASQAIQCVNVLEVLTRQFTPASNAAVLASSNNVNSTIAVKLARDICVYFILCCVRVAM